ncbi:hypothetical protein BJI49_09755 [Acetobacter pasteurianus]|uniref:hypothetical protein n=1 Tax=Acetobacter pasteurianus TaxID=438 RepID=UPI00054D688B|nr:hypothetical protein [Acetobacter pasteurianus]RCL05806.1 hypothetical protein BJI49_09755 [Acetobacter pasteurianus]GCD50136.1 hypothetical protein NBRC106471_1692 [Acetobacter pasteurianus subsp. pasteurianus LMG 1262 = NBRC 106471]
MRTRKEQVAALACALFNKRTDIDECLAIANKYIKEAEERARAECAADTRRLEWLADMKVGVEYREEFGWGVYEILEGMLGEAPTLRAAIDAAMEGGK